MGWGSGRGRWRAPGRAALAAAMAVTSASAGLLAPANRIQASDPAAAHAADPFPTIDGESSGGGAIGAGATIQLRVAGRGDIPADAAAVALNVTALHATRPTFLTTWTTGQPRPVAATLTASPGAMVSNLSVVGLGEDGQVSLYNHAGSLDVVVDVLGWFPRPGRDEAAAPGAFHPLAPARIHESRPGLPTIDGRGRTGTPIAAGATAEIEVLGRAGVPTAGVGAVALNVTSTRGTDPSFLTAWPTGAPRPLAATATVVRGASTSNMVVVGVGGGGTVSLFNHAGSVDVVVDVLGWFEEPPRDDGSAASTETPPADAAAEGYRALTPARLHDTRAEHATHDGAWAGTGALGAAGVTELAVLGRAGIPAAGVGSVVLNVTATGPTAPSYLAVWPTGRPRPLAATLTTSPGSTVSNLVIVGVGERGTVALFNLDGSVDVVVDVLGWFAEPVEGGMGGGVGGEGRGGGFRSVTPARLQDTRVPAPPPREPSYPHGRCDSLADGTDGLALRDDEWPDAHERIGTSVMGRPIWAEYHGPPTPTQVVLVVGQVHGNECAPTRLVHAVRGMSDRAYGIWLVPTLNPDGYAAWSRANAAGRDLNTDGYTASQPETRALLDLTARVRPVLTIHVHSPNGVIAWYGTRPYVAGDAWRSGAPLSGSIAQFVSARSGLQMQGAGERSDRARWFLWQGQRLVHPSGETLLVELHALADVEVPHARPRPPTQPLDVIDAEVRLVLDALDRMLG